MATRTYAARVLMAGAILACIALSVPLMAHAQTTEGSSAELESTIRAALLTDPRTSEMSEAQIEQLVSALAEGAQEEGITSHDIIWKPQRPAAEEEAAVADSCGPLPEMFCALNAAFGLDGSDVAIPITLAITSGILLFVIGAILHHRYGHHPVAGKMEGATSHNPAPRGIPRAEPPQQGPPGAPPPPPTPPSA